MTQEQREDSEDFDGLAPRLRSPPSLPPSLELPTRPPLHDLPLGTLSWEDFERLCCRLVARDGEVRQTTLYGTPGQQQHGIDVLAELRDGTRAVYQCKRYETMTQSDMRKAVDRFLAGRWAGTVGVFGFFTRVSLRDNKLADALTAQTDRLRERGITLERLDLDEISQRCKDAPALVWDFFGEAWAEAFCGPQQVATLGARLRPGDAATLRDELRAFYQRVFAEHDFLPTALGDGPAPSPTSYLVPLDVLERPETLRDRTSVESGQLGDPRHLHEAPGRDPARQDRYRRPPRGENTSDVRQPLWDWLAGGPMSTLVGPGGSGKSSALRWLTCELLADLPAPTALANRWPGHVPVWVPFPRWVQQLADGDDLSLEDAVRNWLQSWDQHKLVPLIDRAFEDGRVLLVVDGLDETHDAESARAAFQRLLVWRGHHGVPMIMAGRRGPTRRLRSSFRGVRVATIAPLSRAQQRDLVRLRLCEASAGPDTHQVDADDEADRFFAALEGTPTGTILSDSPLLLALLLRVWQADGPMPWLREDLLRRVVEVMVEDHPRWRRVASKIRRPSEVPEDEDVSAALAMLAFRIRQRGFSISEADAVSALRDHAQDAERGLGLALRAARRTARQLLVWLRNHLDVLAMEGEQLVIRQRVLLEFLVAQHLASLGGDELLRRVRVHARDPSWQAVWPDLVGLVRSPRLAARVFEVLLELRRSAPWAFHLDLALTRAAVGGGVLPLHARSTWLAEVADALRAKPWWPHRAELVRIVTHGLLCPGLQDEVDQVLATWIPRRHEWPSSLIQAVARWPATKETAASLVQVIADHDEIRARVVAARTLAGMELPSPPEALIALARTHTDPLSLAAAMVALALGWPHAEGAAALAHRAEAGVSQELIVARWLLELERGARPDVPLDALALTDHTHGIELAFQDLLCEVLARSWAGETDRRDQLLGLVRSERRVRWTRLEGEGPSLDLDLARMVLVKAFPGDDEVASYLGEWIDSAGRYSDGGMWELVEQRFQRHPLLVEPVERSLLSSTAHDQPHRSRAAVICGSERARALMLGDLERGTSPVWSAWGLVEGWGVDDPEVHEAIARYVATSPGHAASLATHLHHLEADPAALRRWLLDLWRQDDVEHRDRVLCELLRLMGEERDEEVALAVAEALEKPPWVHSFAWRDAYSALLWHRSIRAEAEAILDHPDAPIASIARGCAAVPDLRPGVLTCLTPLPVGLRRAAWEELARLGPASARARSWLDRFDLEHDAWAKSGGARGWARTVRLRGRPSADTESRIRTGLTCRGHDHEARRQAALVAAIELGQVELLRGLDTEGMPGHRATVRLSRGYGSENSPLLEALTLAWERLDEVLGPDLLSSLGAGHIEDPDQHEHLLFSDRTFEALMQHARPHTPLARRLLDVIEGSGHCQRSAAVLRFLRRCRPASALLRASCLGTLQGPPFNPYWMGAQVAAADILVSEFAEDSDTIALLAAGPDGGLSPAELARQFPARLYGLARAQPDAPAIAWVWEASQGPGWQDMFGRGVAALSVASPEEVTSLLDDWLRDSWDFLPPYGSALRRLLRDRLDRDEALSRGLTSLVESSSRHFVALAPLMSTRHGATAGSDRLKGTIGRELNGESPTLERDLFSGEVVSVLGLAAQLLYGLGGGDPSVV